MSQIFPFSHLVIIVFAVLTAQSAFAETPGQILTSIQESAKTTAGFQGFSAVNGEKFFKSTHGDEWSCSSCHTENPAAVGKHAKTGKIIDPIAPAANAERFTSPKKVAKWFKRNCNDVLNRECTPQEQGDVITYLLTVNK